MQQIEATAVQRWRQDDSEGSKGNRGGPATTKSSAVPELRQDSANALPQVLFVIGPPASGKSTAIKMLRAKWPQHVHVVDELDIVRSLAREGASSEIKRNPDGTLEILDRDSFFERTIRELQRQVASSTSDTPTLCEFARRSYSPVFGQFQPDICANACVLYVQAPLELRRERNEGRRSSNAENYVPESAMTGYYADDDIGELAEMFTDRFGVIENGTNRPSDLAESLDDYFRNKLDPPSGSRHDPAPPVQSDRVL